MSERPIRIQRQRTRGWRMPANTIYVGRPSRWGNPFVAHDWRAAFRAVFLGCRGDRKGCREASVKLYRLWLTAEWRRMSKDDRSWWEREVMTIKANGEPPTLDEIRTELGGKNLACFCRLDEPCHADVLLEIANG